MPNSLFSSDARGSSSLGAGSLSGGSTGDLAEQVQRRLAQADDVFKHIVDDRPLLAIGSAVAAGVILGWLIKRR